MPCLRRARGHDLKNNRNFIKTEEVRKSRKLTDEKSHYRVGFVEGRRGFFGEKFRVKKKNMIFEGLK